MKIISHTSSTVTTETYELSLGDRLLTYIEYLNDKGKLIDCNLRDVDGDEINVPTLLETIQEFVNSFGEGKKQAAEDAAEQQRRDEKHGLYPDREDFAN